MAYPTRIASAFLASALASACSGPPPVIVVAVDRSEHTKAIGDAVIFGANFEGTRAGSPVRVEFVDDKNDPESARRIALGLAARREVLAVIGHASSGITAVAEDVYGRYGIPLLMPVATNPTITAISDSEGWLNAFRLVPRHDLQATAIADFAMSERMSCAQPLIVHDTTAYGNDLGRTIRQVFGNRQIDALVAELSSGSDYRDVSELSERNESTCLIYAGYYQEAQQLIKQLRNTGLEQPIILTDGSFEDELFTDIGINVDNVFVMFIAPDWERVPDASDLVNAFRIEFPNGNPSFAPFAADAVRMIVAALRGGITTRAGLLAHFRSRTFQFDGIANDRYVFNSIGDSEGGAHFVYQVIRDRDAIPVFSCLNCPERMVR